MPIRNGWAVGPAATGHLESAAGRRSRVSRCAGLAGLLILVLLLTRAPVGAQQEDRTWLKDLEVSCIRASMEHGKLPCNEFSHTAGNLALTGLLSTATGLDPEVARWPVLGFYVGKEIRDVARWGWESQWRSSLLDLGFDVLGWWLAPKLF